MGMDVVGRKPDDQVGEYFRNNVWWWRPLADYIIEVAPTLANKNPYWHSNDGTGLGKRDSVRLADILQAKIDSGECQAYADAYEAERKALPRQTCEWCGGTGIRTDEVGVKNGMPEREIHEAGHPRDGQTGWCNGCNGVGTRESFGASYPFSVDNVQEFANFLRHSGGFRIY